MYSPWGHKESDMTEWLSLSLLWRKMTELRTCNNVWFHNFAQPFLKETSCIGFSWKGFLYLYYATWTLFHLLLKKEIPFLSDNSSLGKEDSNYWAMARINSALFSERHPYQMRKKAFRNMHRMSSKKKWFMWESNTQRKFLKNGTCQKLEKYIEFQSSASL